MTPDLLIVGAGIHRRYSRSVSSFPAQLSRVLAPIPASLA
jgi:hypothetical protein